MFIEGIPIVLPSPPLVEVPFISEAFEGVINSGGAGRGDGLLSMKPRPPPVFVGIVVFIWSLFGIMVSPERVGNQFSFFGQDVVVVDDKRNVPRHLH